MRVDFVTLFPETVRAMLAEGILVRAKAAGLVEFRAVNPRDYCYDRHQKVDDAPFGGAPGMLIRVEPVALALASLNTTADAAVVLTDPAGPLFRQSDARALSTKNHVVFLCGHYEGFDHRVQTHLATHAFSIGDFVLTNGELPALVMADAVLRLVPGVLGNAASLEADSHADGLLSAPNYTQPDVWRDAAAPAVLKSGNHAAIARWRREQSLRLTRAIRPDLLASAPLRKADIDVLSSEGDPT